MMHIIGVKACISLRTNLLLIGQDRNRCIGWLLCLNLCCECCISTNAVILAIGPNKAAVKTDIPCLVCRNHFNLCAVEILLCDPVLFIEKGQCKKLYGLLYILILEWKGAYYNVELLAL